MLACASVRACAAGEVSARSDRAPRAICASARGAAAIKRGCILQRRWNMNVCIRVPGARAHGPSEFIKYEIRCEEKHQGQGWGGAGRNACNMRCEIYIPNRLFTVRLLKLLAYTLTSTRARGGGRTATLYIPVSNCIDITSPKPMRARAGLLPARVTFGVVVHLQAKRSRVY
jgi:hypothetical protein